MLPCALFLNRRALSDATVLVILFVIAAVAAFILNLVTTGLVNAVVLPFVAAVIGAILYLLLRRKAND